MEGLRAAEVWLDHAWKIFSETFSLGRDIRNFVEERTRGRGGFIPGEISVGAWETHCDRLAALTRSVIRVDRTNVPSGCEAIVSQIQTLELWLKPYATDNATSDDRTLYPAICCAFESIGWNGYLAIKEASKLYPPAEPFDWPQEKQSPRSCSKCGEPMPPKDFDREECAECRRSNTFATDPRTAETLEKLRETISSRLELNAGKIKHGEKPLDHRDFLNNVFEALHRLKAPGCIEPPWPRFETAGEIEAKLRSILEGLSENETGGMQTKVSKAKNTESEIDPNSKRGRAKRLGKAIGGLQNAYVLLESMIGRIRTNPPLGSLTADDKETARKLYEGLAVEPHKESEWASALASILQNLDRWYAATDELSNSFAEFSILIDDHLPLKDKKYLLAGCIDAMQNWFFFARPNTEEERLLKACSVVAYLKCDHFPSMESRQEKVNELVEFANGTLASINVLLRSEDIRTPIESTVAGNITPITPQIAVQSEKSGLNSQVTAGSENASQLVSELRDSLSNGQAELKQEGPESAVNVIGALRKSLLDIIYTAGRILDFKSHNVRPSWKHRFPSEADYQIALDRSKSVEQLNWSIFPDHHTPEELEAWREKLASGSDWPYHLRELEDRFEAFHKAIKEAFEFLENIPDLLLGNSNEAREKRTTYWRAIDEVFEPLRWSEKRETIPLYQLKQALCLVTSDRGPTAEYWEPKLRRLNEIVEELRPDDVRFQDLRIKRFLDDSPNDTHGDKKKRRFEITIPLERISRKFVDSNLKLGDLDEQIKAYFEDFALLPPKHPKHLEMFRNLAVEVFELCANEVEAAGVDRPSSLKEWRTLCHEAAIDFEGKTIQWITEALVGWARKSGMKPRGKGKSTNGSRGRNLETDPKEDQRILDAWKTGRHKTHAELGIAMNMTTLEVKRACDRARKR